MKGTNSFHTMVGLEINMKSLSKQVGGDHYKKMNIQVVEFWMANNIPAMEGAVIKYLCRWKDKDGIKDLKKAEHFLQMLIEYETNKKTYANNTRAEQQQEAETVEKE